MISKRGRKMIGEPSPLVTHHFICVEDLFNPATNPAGKINFGTAENHLMDEVMLEKLNAPLEYSAHHLHYDISHGTASFRAAVARLMKDDLGISDVDPENLVVAAGATAIQEALSMALFEEGEGLVIATPLYTGFIHDFSTRFGVKILPYPLSPHNGYNLEIVGLKKVIEAATQDGTMVRAILMCSPNNPLGITYSAQKLREIVEVAQEYQLDIISDEIYAQSVYQGVFASLLEVGKDYRQHIHFVYGFAKDFVLSGFKAGVLYSENQELAAAVKVIAYFHSVSNQTQAFIENMLKDQAWRRGFIKENQARLGAAYTLTTSMLASELNVRTVEADAGIFVWADFSHYLAAETFEAELELFNHIFYEGGVSISPGQFFLASTPGWFRICFAQKDENIKTGVRRLREILVGK